MISLKKTAIAAALAFGMVGAAQAAPTYTFAFDGFFVMHDASGAIMDNGNGEAGDVTTGTMVMDMGSGVGSAVMASTVPFYGDLWTAHAITLTATGPGTVQANMLFDWGVNANISVSVDFSMTPTAPGVFSIATLDGDADGVMGNLMNNGPFEGVAEAAFFGTATVIAVDPGTTPVPVPAAAWLLGSGLLGLVGVARRKTAVVA